MTDLDILTLTLWGEARGEPIDSIIAVGCVIRNRTIAAKITYAAVCQAPHQFSCWTEEADQMAGAALQLATPDAYLKQCQYVAYGILGNQLIDNTHGANHYYAAYIAPPAWALGHKPLVKLGKHLFFNVA